MGSLPPGCSGTGRCPYGGGSATDCGPPVARRAGRVAGCGRGLGTNWVVAAAPGGHVVPGEGSGITRQRQETGSGFLLGRGEPGLSEVRGRVGDVGQGG